ncbi:YceI family protein [Winogradskyella maritima]|uniref:YceI family protein n=1 Tax=Winogradskyella maritima TaxID=1517766 RepID=A0ABV8ANS8_9FLAO|nr:YceI family protein [Winogradskyella maritima]
MKKLVFSLVAIATLSLTSCNDKAKEAETSEAEEAAVAEVTATAYTISTDDSTIMWKGFKPTGTHNGEIAVSGGDLSVEDGMIKSGTVTIDMGTIEVKDIPAEEEGNAKLKGHLSSPDFFDVETYPTAKFVVTGMSEADGKTMLQGNLTLKDATNNVSIPVSTSMNGDVMTLTSEAFTIDRSKWNVKYGSKSFFDDLGDSFINDDIELQISVKANKA